MVYPVAGGVKVLLPTGIGIEAGGTPVDGWNGLAVGLNSFTEETTAANGLLVTT